MDELRLEDLDADQRQRLAMMQQLRRDEAAWRSARLVVLGAAAELVDSGRLHVAEACAALEISVPTWYRRRAELRAYLAGKGGDVARADGDQAAAGAREQGFEWLGAPEPPEPDRSHQATEHGRDGLKRRLPADDDVVGGIDG